MSDDKYTPDADGLFQKYTVYRNDKDGIPQGTDDVVGVLDCFVLRIHDPHARQAILAYAESIISENPKLAGDLALWLIKYRSDNKIQTVELQ